MKAQKADSKGRLSLGSDYAGQLFQIDTLPDGRIVLDKAAVIPERELLLHKNKGREKSVKRGAEKGVAAGNP